MKRFLIAGFLFVLLLSTLALADTNKLLGIHLLTHGKETQIALDVNNKVAYKLFTLPTPPRIVIDLPTMQLATSLEQVPLANTIITQIRQGHPIPGTLRIVFDVKQPLHPTATYTKTHGQLRLIITLQNTTASTISANEKKTSTLTQTQTWAAQSLAQSLAAKTDASVATTTQTSAPLTLTVEKPSITEKRKKTLTAAPTATPPPTPLLTDASNNGRRPIIIVIDPGHGGKDPGTTGPLGVHEKDVVLAISLDLRNILAQQTGFKAVMTRNADYFIPLRGRLSIARKDHGDMFIAIHADAFKDPYATGASVFALSAHGASSEAALWIAEKENYSELGGVTLNDKSDVLRSVLIDLSQTATIASSIQLGTSLLQQLGKVGSLHHATVEQAPFMVLKSPDIPSVLVETGFLSNPEEEERLRNPLHQEEIAQALAKGIENYFWNNPPPGTLIASLKNAHEQP